MDEDHFYEIESVLLYIAEARQRAAKACESLRKQGAEPHLIAAAETAEAAMRAEHRRLVQATHFATPGQNQLAV